MSEWVMTTYEQTPNGWQAVEYVKDDATNAKHGAFTVDLGGENWFSSGTCKVKVYDDTNGGINDAELLEIAHEVAITPIFWSDGRLCHWFYDFECAGHWVEGLFHNNGLPDEVDQWQPVHVRVYD